MTWLSVWPHNEASSGTTPTTVADAQSSPLNLTITYGGADAWTSIAGGNGLQYINATRSKAAIGSTKLDIFGGTCKVAAGEIFANWSNGDFGRGLSILGGSGQNIFTMYRLDGGNSGGGAGSIQLYVNNANQRGTWALPGSLVSATGHHFLISVDTTLATAADRSILYIDGFKFANTGTTHTQNDVLGTFTSPEIVIGAASAGGEPWDTPIFGAGFSDAAISAAEALDRALHWFGDNDTAPIATGARLLATGGAGIQGGSANGGTTDVSSSTSDHTASGTLTIGASGNNRIVELAITYEGVSTGITAIAFDTAGANTTMVQAVESAASGDGAAIYYLNDAALPASAGTYTWSVTVDGASGVVAATPNYYEGIGAQAPINTQTGSGTATSSSITLSSNVAAGSIVSGVLFDNTAADNPLVGARQLPISRIACPTASATHKHATSSRYVPSSASVTMSYTGLTNSSDKRQVAVEWATTASATHISTGRADETDAALATTLHSVIAMGRADETDTALALNFASTAHLDVGRADETDTALALTLHYALQVGMAVEFDAAASTAPASMQPQGAGGGGGPSPRARRLRRRRT